MINKLIQSVIFLVTLATIIQDSQQKFVKKTINTKTLTKQGFEYFTKFGIDIGVGAIKYRVKLRKKFTDRQVANLEKKDEKLVMDFLILLDEEYETIDHETMTCAEKYNKASKQQKVTLNTDGDWTEWKKKSLSQFQRQHIWYFALGNCDGSAALMGSRGYQVDVEILMLNSNESQFSSEETGIITLYALSIVIFVGAIVYLQARYLKMSERDWPIIILILSFALLFFHTLFYFIHLCIYSYDGQGSLTFQILSATCNIGSQFILTVLLVLLAFGWTINFQQIQNLELVIPIVAFIGTINVIIICLGFVNNDTDYKYHPYDGWVGVVLIILRLATFIFFIVQITKLIQNTKSKASDFLANLQIWGSVYLLAIPLTVGLGQLFAYYLQHRIIMIGTLAFQISAILFLAHSFIGKNSGYQKVAMRNRTELPSAFGSKFD